MIKFYFGGPELPFGLPFNVKSLEAYLNCDIVRMQRQEGLPPSQIAASFQVSEADIAKCPNASSAAEAAPAPVGSGESSPCGSQGKSSP